MDITKLRTPDELLADSVFEEVFEIQDPIERSKLI